MLNQRILLVADTAFIDSETIKQHRLLSVFPREVGDGAYRSSLDELLQRSRLQSAFFDELLPQLIPAFKKYMPTAGNEVGSLVRPALITVTSLFVDRCIRVLHRIQQQHAKDIAVVKVEPTSDFQWHTEISQDWHLNQNLIQRIMVALNYEKVDVLNKETYPEYPNLHIQENLIFRPHYPGLSGVLSKLLSRSFGFLEIIPNNRAKFKSLGFTMDRYYLAKRGLIGPFGIFQNILKVEFEPSEKNLGLRDNLFTEIKGVVRLQFELFFSQIYQNLPKYEMNQLSQAYARLFIDWFPIGFLEDLSSNLEKVRQSLNMDNIVGIVGHSMTSGLGYLASAVARLAGKTVIGIQHGGHYGYIEDLSMMGQTEYALCDKFITFGWTCIDDHLPKCQTIPLPSPKLSEQPFKANYISKEKSPNSNTRDILFLSNKWIRFPSTTTGGHPRVDFIDEIKISQEKLVKATRDAQLSMDHKPFGMTSVDLYAEHFRRLEAIGGPKYRLIKSTHKGLTIELIKTCRILLWDQIGTGTLEAFTSEVPTIVYWQRIYSRESPWAKELIAGLELHGIVHTDAKKLAQEIKTYLADPESWMNNSDRKQAIQKFCRKFAWASDDWAKLWRNYLADLNKS